MKQFLKILFPIASFITSIGFSQSTDLSILEKSVEKMNALEYFTVDTDIEILCHPENDFFLYKSKVYCDMTSNDTFLGSKYRDFHTFQSKHYKREEITIFNGDEYFVVRPYNKEVLLLKNLNKQIINTSWGIQNSIAGFCKVLPKIINNPFHRIVKNNDTLINGIDSYRFDIQLANGHIYGSTIKSIPQTPENTYITKYQLYLDKKTLLPSSFIKYSNNKIMSIYNYSNFSVSKKLNDKELDIKNFPSNYKLYDYEEYYNNGYYKTKALLNSKMDDWSLVSIQNQQISQNDLKGKFTLLQFMFADCGYCVQAVPELNTLKETYKDKLEILSIDFQNSSLESLKKYHSETDAKFQVLRGGKDLAEKYGINMGPTFLLLDKDSKVIWLQRGSCEWGITGGVKKHL